MPDDNLRVEAFGGRSVALEELEHALHGGNSQSMFGLADGGEWDTKVLADEDVPKTNNREILRNSEALAKENVGCTDGDKVVDGLDSGCARRFVEQLERGLFAFLDGAAGVEDQLVIEWKSGFTMGAFVAFQPFLGGRCSRLAGEKGDSPMAEVKQMLGGRGAGKDVFSLDTDERGAERSAMPEQHRRSAAFHQLLINRRRGCKAINRSDEQPINPAPLPPG